MKRDTRKECEDAFKKLSFHGLLMPGITSFPSWGSEARFVVCKEYWDHSLECLIRDKKKNKEVLKKFMNV